MVDSQMATAPSGAVSSHVEEVIVQDGRAEEQAVQAVQHASVAGEERPRVLHPGPPLEQALQRSPTMPSTETTAPSATAWEAGIGAGRTADDQRRRHAAGHAPGPFPVLPGEIAGASLCLPSALPTKKAACPRHDHREQEHDAQAPRGQVEQRRPASVLRARPGRPRRGAWSPRRARWREIAARQREARTRDHGDGRARDPAAGGQPLRR